MQNLDKISVIGIALALLAILGGQALEGGHIASLLQLTAFLIVLGGTFGAVMLQSSSQVFLRGMRLAKWVFTSKVTCIKPKPKSPGTIFFKTFTRSGF